MEDLPRPTAVPVVPQVTIPRDPRAPTLARRAVEQLCPQLAGDVAPDVKLLVSEIVTNSVKYGGEGDVTLLLDSDDPLHVRIEVVDQGHGFEPVQRTRPMTDVGGWGLHLVEALSERWGVEEGSTHVWFEIDRRDGRRPVAA